MQIDLPTEPHDAVLLSLRMGRPVAPLRECHDRRADRAGRNPGSSSDGDIVEQIGGERGHARRIGIGTKAFALASALGSDRSTNWSARYRPHLPRR